jgi:hypothetical protein
MCAVKARIVSLLRAVRSGAYWFLGIVVTWGIAFRLAYAHYRGDWFSFWVIVGAWLALSGWALVWFFGDQGDPGGAAERKAFWGEVDAILTDPSLDPLEAHAAAKALMEHEPKHRVVSRASKQWDRLSAWWEVRREQ